MKKCIFYLPYKLDARGAGARMLRPKKMIQAFRDIGYDVFVIQGTASERKVLIKKLKTSISDGEEYSFMYAEASTMPTLLTDPGHLPLHPFVDYGFFRFVKQHGIKIGLFYCDVYWKFPNYAGSVKVWKRVCALQCYKYDIRQYKKYLDKFYVADKRVCDHLGDHHLSEISSELPPGAENLTVERIIDTDYTNRPLRVFYVGGIGNHYQILELVRSVCETENTELIICCREKEWFQEKNKYEPYLCDRIRIVHNSGDELEQYYSKADICSLVFRRSVYMDMAKPFKAYEYLAHEIPVISTRGTGIGQFVEENNVGWRLDYFVVSKDIINKVKNPTIYDEVMGSDHCPISIDLDMN